MYAAASREQKMERALAEEMVREILAIGKSHNHLYDLIEANIAEGELKQQFKRLLAEAIAGVGYSLLMPIIRLYPDLDPDR
jgi:hypothetical protein